MKKASIGNLHDALRIFVFRGPPAVGKSTIAKKALSLLPGNRKGYIPIDCLQHLDARRSTKEKLRLGVFNAALLCRSFLNERFNLVVDYVFDEHLDLFIETIFSRSEPAKTIQAWLVHLIYLHADEKVVLRRNRRRVDPMPDTVLKRIYARCESTRGHFPGELEINTAASRMSVKKAALLALHSDVALNADGSVVHVRPLF